MLAKDRDTSAWLSRISRSHAGRHRARAQRALDAVHNELARHSVPLGNVQFITAAVTTPARCLHPDDARLYSSIDLEIQR